MNSKKHTNIAIFIPHYGCNNECVFCNQNSITGKKDIVTEEDMISTIESYIKHSNGARLEIAFFGGSFTGISQKIQKKFLDIAQNYVDNGYVSGIRFSTRPDYIDENQMEFLSNYTITCIELGVQSLDNEVLFLTKRNHSISDVDKAVELIKKANYKLGLQMMLGLVGDNDKKSIETAKKIISYKPDFIRIYPTIVLKDTALEKMYYNGLYKALTLDETINLMVKICPLFLKENIDIIRIGLYSNDKKFFESVVAGPIHPSIKSIVFSELYFKKLRDIVKKNKDDDIKIYANKSDISYIIGHNGMNKKRLDFNIKIVNTDINRYSFIYNNKIYKIYDEEK